MPHGKGTLYWSSGSPKYQGDLKEGKRDGEGTEFTPDGVVDFAGVFRDDQRVEGRIHKGLDLWESYHGSTPAKSVAAHDAGNDEGTKKQETK